MNAVVPGSYAPVVDHDQAVARYAPVPAGGGWSPALAVVAGLVGVLMWGGLILAAAEIGGAATGVVREATLVTAVML